MLTYTGRRGQINRGPASVIGGGRNGNAAYRYYQSQSDNTNSRGNGNCQNGYRRFQDYSSFSSFSDTSSIVRRPSMDTISTYLSNQDQYQNGYGNYGGYSRSFYGGSFRLVYKLNYGLPFPYRHFLVFYTPKKKN